MILKRSLNSFWAARLPLKTGFNLLKGVFMKNLKQKIAIGLAIASSALGLSAPVHAEGIADIGTTMATEIAKAVPVVTSVGMALLSVYVVMKAFRLVTSFMGGK